MPIVEVPPRYRGPTNGRALIEVQAGTVRESIEAVEAQFPGFGELILDGAGNLRRYVSLFLNGTAVERNAVDTAVADTDNIQILASVAGG